MEGLARREAAVLSLGVVVAALPRAAAAAACAHEALRLTGHSAVPRADETPEGGSTHLSLLSTPTKPKTMRGATYGLCF